MKPVASFLAVQIVLLLVLQAGALAVLWFLNPLTQSATDTFALILSIDILAFVVMSYVYRSYKGGNSPGDGWMALGYVTLAVLLALVLVVV